MSAMTAILLVIVLGSPALAWSQSAGNRPYTAEVSVAPALGHVFRFEDVTFGNQLNAGGSFAFVLASGWAIEVEGSRTFGLTPRATPCAMVGVTCVGAGHDGVREAASVSMVLQYRFKGRRFQPYLLAGLGILRTESVHSLTQVARPLAFISESASRDTGMGPDLGAGVRMRLSRRWSISPEVRWLEGAWGSRENLAITRLSLRVAYGWQ